LGNKLNIILQKIGNALLLGVALCLLAIPDTTAIADTGQADKPYMTKEFEVNDPALLKVFTVGGNVDIVPSSSSDKVKVELYLDRGFAFWSNSKNLDNYRITMLQRGNEIVASVERKRRDTGFFSDRMSFSFRIFVPESISSEIKTLGGNISLAEVSGRQSLKTGGGNISINNIQGHLEAYTAGGNISVRKSQGTLYAQTEGGNIELDQSKGEIRLKTNGGRITSDRTSGTLLAQVGGGDISASFVEVSKGVHLQTSAGNIRLQVPDQAGYEITMNGSDLRFSPDNRFHGSIKENTIEGTYKEGGPPLSMDTNSGTVTLEIN